MEWWAYVLTGGAAAAIVKIIDNIIQWRLLRRAKKEDNANISIAQMADAITSLRTAQMVILHDRIKFLSRSYVCADEIELEDLRDLEEMHNIYQSLGGKNLIRPMEDVKKLKLKYN